MNQRSRGPITGQTIYVSEFARACKRRRKIAAIRRHSMEAVAAIGGGGILAWLAWALLERLAPGV
jgi:hypothetical protein